MISAHDLHLSRSALLAPSICRNVDVVLEERNQSECDLMQSINSVAWTARHWQDQLMQSHCTEDLDSHEKHIQMHASD